MTDYSVKGQLLGHLVMGAQEAADAAREAGIPEEKSVLLQHMILSHHGEPEYGAAVRPMCAESELLSEIDIIDSRMEIYREQLAQVPEGAFSGRIFCRIRRSIITHKNEHIRNPPGWGSRPGKERHVWTRLGPRICWTFWTAVPPAITPWRNWPRS